MQEQRTNPAASGARLAVALGVLFLLACLTWFTLDASATVHVHGYSSGLLSFPERDVPIRWFPMLILALFAVRVLLANARARLESKRSQQDR